MHRVKINRILVWPVLQHSDRETQTWCRHPESLAAFLRRGRKMCHKRFLFSRTYCTVQKWNAWTVLFTTGCRKIHPFDNNNNHVSTAELWKYSDAERNAKKHKELLFKSMLNRTSLEHHKIISGRSQADRQFGWELLNAPADVRHAVNEWGGSQLLRLEREHGHTVFTVCTASNLWTERPGCRFCEHAHLTVWNDLSSKWCLGGGRALDWASFRISRLFLQLSAIFSNLTDTHTVQTFVPLLSYS